MKKKSRKPKEELKDRRHTQRFTLIKWNFIAEQAKKRDVSASWVIDYYLNKGIEADKKN